MPRMLTRGPAVRDTARAGGRTSRSARCGAHPRRVDPLRPSPPPARARRTGRKSALAFFGVLLALFLPALLAQVAHPVRGPRRDRSSSPSSLPALVATAGSNLTARALPAAPPARGRALVVARRAHRRRRATSSRAAVMTLTQRLLPPSWVETYDLSRLFEGPRWERVALAARRGPARARVRGDHVPRLPPDDARAARGDPSPAIAGGALLFAVLHLDPVRFPALRRPRRRVRLDHLARRARSGRRSPRTPPTTASPRRSSSRSAGAPEPSAPPRVRDRCRRSRSVGSALALLLLAFRAAAPPDRRPPRPMRSRCATRLRRRSGSTRARVPRRPRGRRPRRRGGARRARARRAPRGLTRRRDGGGVGRACRAPPGGSTAAAASWWDPGARSDARRRSPVHRIVVAALLLLCSPAIASARGPSTAAERKRAVEITRRLEKEPLSRSGVEARAVAAPVHRRDPRLQRDGAARARSTRSRRTRTAPYARLLYVQSIFGMAAFMFEHPEAGGRLGRGPDRGDREHAPGVPVAAARRLRGALEGARPARRGEERGEAPEARREGDGGVREGRRTRRTGSDRRRRDAI